MSITINEQGQITIPEEICKRIGWKPGTKFVFDIGSNGETVLCPERVGERFREGPLKDVISILPPWPGGTDAYMEFIRGPYEELPPSEE
jgi:AbrB family looped-hinge helix DNA binding protein